MTPARRGLYRAASGVLCAAFIVVGAAFLLVPARLLAVFDAWSRRVGLATSAGEPGELYVVLAVAYMYVVSLLAWSMYRHPEDPRPARLLVHAKAASAALSFAVFCFRQPHLVLLVNGIVDGAIAGLVVLLLAGSAARAEERSA